MIIGGKSCHSCEFSLALQRLTFCTRFPPQVYVAPINTPTGPVPGLQASYPPVNPELPCGEYRRNELKAGQQISQARNANEHLGLSS